MGEEMCGPVPDFGPVSRTFVLYRSVPHTEKTFLKKLLRQQKDFFADLSPYGLYRPVPQIANVFRDGPVPRTVLFSNANFF